MITEYDKGLIDALLKKMAEAWASGDGQAYGSLFWDDARYVEAPGFRAIGAAVIAQRHQQIFDTFFKHTRIGGDFYKDIQELSTDAVIVHSEGNVFFPGEFGKKLEPNGLISMCLVKRDGVWKIASFQNTPTGKFRGPKFFLRFLISRFYIYRGKWQETRKYMLADKRRNIEKWEAIRDEGMKG